MNAVACVLVLNRKAPLTITALETSTENFFNEKLKYRLLRIPKGDFSFIPELSRNLYIQLKRKNLGLCWAVEVHIFNPSIGEAEAGGSL